MLSPRDTRTLLVHTHLEPDAHAEDAFVASFAAFVARHRGAGPLHDLAIEYAGDLLDEIMARCPDLDLASARCRRAVRSVATGSRHILVRDLLSWVDSVEPTPPRPRCSHRVAA